MFTKQNRNNLNTYICITFTNLTCTINRVHTCTPEYRHLVVLILYLDTVYIYFFLGHFASEKTLNLIIQKSYYSPEGCG